MHRKLTGVHEYKDEETIKWYFSGFYYSPCFSYQWFMASLYPNFSLAHAELTGVHCWSSYGDLWLGIAFLHVIFSLTYRDVLSFHIITVDALEDSMS